MEFKVLAVGDVVGAPGMEQIRRRLHQLKRKVGADFVVVNGENASVVGIVPDQADGSSKDDSFRNAEAGSTSESSISAWSFSPA